jgi:hypothetical protein
LKLSSSVQKIRKTVEAGFYYSSPGSTFTQPRKRSWVRFRIKKGIIDHLPSPSVNARLHAPSRARHVQNLKAAGLPFRSGGIPGKYQREVAN